MNIDIKRLDGSVFFNLDIENNTIKKTVEAMLLKFNGTVIRDIDLSNQHLSDIKFYNSKFDNSKFYNSKFYNSTFYNSTFDNSKFYNSKFDNSTFYNSTFDNSKFYNSTFDNSKFYNSTFYNSKFYNGSAENALKNGAFGSIKMDFFGRMILQKNEVSFLKKKLQDGEIDGTQYEGECGCFVGTIAKALKVNYLHLPNLKPYSNAPTEKWFFAIRKGDTPGNNVIAKITFDWIEEFEQLMK